MELHDTQPRTEVDQFVETTLAVSADAEEAVWGFGEQFTCVRVTTCGVGFSLVHVVQIF